MQYIENDSMNLSLRNNIQYLGDEIQSPFHAVPLFLEYFHNINITRIF